MSTLEVDLDLVRKYNEAGPRYTSYPPVNVFSGTFDKEELDKSIHASDTEGRPISLYFHLPFCHHLCWFCGCNKIIASKPEKADEYIDYLEKEIQLRAYQVSSSREVVQLHYGGGTPTFFSAKQLDRLSKLIHKHFKVSEDAELSIEIDPRTLKPDQPIALAEQGFWRASLGIQDFNPQVQEAVHRVQPEDMTRRAVGSLRKAGFKSVNVDLIYGLPHQTEDTFTDTLRRALKLNPDRFAVFNYAHVPWMIPAQKIIKEETLPTPETKLAMLKVITETLTDHGYHFIGLDHFARQDDELSLAQKSKTLQRNFQGYSTSAGVDIQAYGVSSISQNKTAYYQNEKDINRWQERLDQNDTPTAKAYVLSMDDQIRRSVIMELMCNLYLDFEKLSLDFQIDFTEYFESELKDLETMAEDGLLTLNSDYLEITDTGRLLIRNIAMRFDVYYQKQVRRYSKTI